jgi:hypothetical protein
VEPGTRVAEREGQRLDLHFLALSLGMWSQKSGFMILLRSSQKNRKILLNADNGGFTQMENQNTPEDF